MELSHKFRQAHRVMAKSNRLLAVCHRRPDGDTLGAATACLLWCRREGIQAKAFCVDILPPRFSALPEADKFTDDEKVFGEHWDTIVVIDTGDLKHAGVADLVGGLKFPRPAIVAIDHHKTNDSYADVNVVEPSASSASELMLGFFRENGIHVDSEMATCLLAGIVNDTDTLTNPAASRPAFRAASQLISDGADWRTMLGLFVKNRPLEALRLMGKAMDRLKYDPETGLATTAIFADDCPDGVDCQVDGLSNFLGGTLDVDVILVLREKGDGTVTGSFRTVGDADVSAVSQRLGGGGHQKAAGFSVSGRIVEREHGWTVERE